MSSPMLTIERSKDRISYYADGVLHREDGPAIEHRSGIVIWYRHGLRHREDGPAAIYPALPSAATPTSGFNCWYLNGVRYSEEEYNMITFFGVLGE
jgi:hypothetical protein